MSPHANGEPEPRLPAGLGEILRVPAERDLPEGRHQTLKEHLMSELRHTDRAGSGIAAPGPRRRSRLLAATAVAGVLAVAGGLGVAALRGQGAPPGGHAGPGGPRTAAAQLLGKIALAAERQPAPAVRDSQYTYIASWVVDYQPPQACLLVNGRCRPIHPRGLHAPKPHKRQIWISVSNLCRPGLLREPAAGSANLPLTDGGSCPDRGELNDPTYRFLQSLPTDPRALLKLIYKQEKGHGTGPAQEAFTTIGDLLRESIAPPAVSAALYRAAALIPGVTVVRDVRDVVGQRGVAVAFTQTPSASASPAAHPAGGSGGAVAQEWIFDPSTLQWIGECSFSGGKPQEGSAILTRAIVNRPGQVPGGR